MTPDDQELIQARQKSRARILAILLFAFVILVFVITIVRIGGDVANRTF